MQFPVPDVLKAMRSLVPAALLLQSMAVKSLSVFMPALGSKTGLRNTWPKASTKAHVCLLLVHVIMNKTHIFHMTNVMITKSQRNVTTKSRGMNLESRIYS